MHNAKNGPNGMQCTGRTQNIQDRKKETPQMILLTVQLSMNGLHAKDY